MISPWVIYLIEILYNIDRVANLALLASIFSAGFWFMLWCTAIHKGEEERIIAHCKKYLCYSLIAMAVLLIPICFIPERQAMYGMLMANCLTPENIEILRSFGVETIQQLSDVIIESIGKAVQKGE